MPAKGNYRSKEEVIQFYRDELAKQGINNPTKLDRSKFPIDIPKKPEILGIKNSEITSVYKINYSLFLFCS